MRDIVNREGIASGRSDAAEALGLDPINAGRADAASGSGAAGAEDVADVVPLAAKDRVEQALIDHHVHDGRLVREGIGLGIDEDDLIVPLGHDEAECVVALEDPVHAVDGRDNRGKARGDVATVVLRVLTCGADGDAEDSQFQVAACAVAARAAFGAVTLDDLAGPGRPGRVAPPRDGRDGGILARV